MPPRQPKGGSIVVVPAPAAPDIADLDPGQRIWGETVFVDIVHPDIEGSRASVPEHLVEHHAGRGWVLADSPATADEDPPAVSTDDTDDLSPQED